MVEKRKRGELFTFRPVRHDIEWGTRNFKLKSQKGDFQFFTMSSISGCFFTLYSLIFIALAIVILPGYLISLLRQDLRESTQAIVLQNNRRGNQIWIDYQFGTTSDGQPIGAATIGYIAVEQSDNHSLSGSAMGLYRAAIQSIDPAINDTNLGDIQLYEGADDIPWSCGNRLRPGEIIEIEYNRQNPTDSGIVGSCSGEFEDTVGLFITLPLVALFLYGIYKDGQTWWKYLRLRRGGVLVKGQIRKAEITPRKAGNQKYYELKVDYEFRSPDNSLLLGSDTKRLGSGRHIAPLPGEPIAVVYCKPDLFMMY